MLDHAEETNHPREIFKVSSAVIVTIIDRTIMASFSQREILNFLASLRSSDMVYIIVIIIIIFF